MQRRRYLSARAGRKAVLSPCPQPRIALDDEETADGGDDTAGEHFDWCRRERIEIEGR